MKAPLTRVVVPFQFKANVDPASHTFEGLAAVWDKDLGNDIIHKGAFKDTLIEWKSSGDAIPLLNSHNHFDIMSALGQMISGKETKDGLWTQWEVIDGPEGEAVIRRLQPSKTTKRPIVGKMSIGFVPVEWKFEQPPGTDSFFDRIRHITKIDLKEVSLVLFPMAPGAAIDVTSVKSFMLSAQATDPKTLDAVTKMELRKLNTRIGLLLKKQADTTASPAKETPDGESPARTPTPPSPKAADDNGTSGLPDDVDDIDETDDDEDLLDEDDLGDDVNPPDIGPDADDETIGDENEEPGKAAKQTPEPKQQTKDPVTPTVYEYAEAMQQRIQKVLLKHKVAEIGHP